MNKGKKNNFVTVICLYTQVDIFNEFERQVHT